MNVQQHEYGWLDRYGGEDFTGSTAYRRLAPDQVIRVISLPLMTLGTSSSSPTRVWTPRFVPDPIGTAVRALSLVDIERVTTRAPEHTRGAVSELHRVSGLTWDQVAGLFDVSRRSVHFWASGKSLSAAHEQRLFRVLEAVRWADRGDARSNRSALLAVYEGGTALELLSMGNYEAARKALGPGKGRRHIELGELDDVAKADRRPPPPAELIDAVDDPVRQSVGGGPGEHAVRDKLRGLVE